ncbi:MAG: hypothetical protein A3E60_01190 [Candidatus Kerfeldbacteria bacterium RIFCSPHIGHO2_12_FULL_42_13]|nr:MAG: hypothetical protein A3E60_01190 [Candidatus Kerfeldbacteria bacterium RIFCSPHIGHO2_12_FULL_42_13]OGY85572.1 MAG: hypothetical protein A3G01_03750 [Candidatus Kerfeldbacteria bacterium RIFCSPLOWO2_12_FULL_43_9]
MSKEINSEEQKIAKAIAVKLFKFLIDNFPHLKEEKIFPLKQLRESKQSRVLQENEKVLSAVRSIFVQWRLAVGLRGDTFFIRHIGPY